MSNVTTPSMLIRTGQCPVGHGQLVRRSRCEQCHLTFVCRAGGGFISGMSADYVQITLGTQHSNYVNGYSVDFTYERFDSFSVLDMELFNVQIKLQECTGENSNDGTAKI